MDVVPQNLHWLIPEEAAPCDIFLHFRGQNALGLPRGQIISFEFHVRVYSLLRQGLKGCSMVQSSLTAHGNGDKRTGTLSSHCKLPSASGVSPTANTNVGTI